MAKYIRLSYLISGETPLYPGSPKTELKQVKDMNNHDSCNAFYIGISNHAGTHIDAPAHFIRSGRTISDYSVDELVFTHVSFVDRVKEAGEPITVSDLREASISENCDAVIIRTGFQKYRINDPGKYITNGPFLSPDAALWLRKERPSVKLLGIDCVSIANSTKKKEGKESHIALLGPEGSASRPILILEDMYIPEKLEKIDTLIVAPLFFSAIDSSPCTVIGVLND